MRKYNEMASCALTMGSPPVWPKSYERNSAPRNVASDGALSLSIQTAQKRRNLECVNVEWVAIKLETEVKSAINCQSLIISFVVQPKAVINFTFQLFSDWNQCRLGIGWIQYLQHICHCANEISVNFRMKTSHNNRLAVLRRLAHVVWGEER